MGYEPEYNKRTTVEERAVAYSRGVKYVGGEVQLAMQAAVMTAYIEGYRDRRAEEYYPVNTAESFEGYLHRRLGDNYTAIVIAALDALRDENADDETLAALAALAAISEAKGKI
jgi:hypothetical protein